MGEFKFAERLLLNPLMDVASVNESLERIRQNLIHLGKVLHRAENEGAFETNDAAF